MKNIRAHVFISGAVQGVCFRYDARRQAQTRGLTGWVRNRYDGRVEAVFEGPEGTVNDIIEWCRKGPEGAVVHGVEVKREDYKGEFAGFNIYPGE